MALRDVSERNAAGRLRARIILVLSSSSIATTVLSSGGCGGEVGGDGNDQTGTAGSRSGTGGTASGTGGRPGTVGGIGGANVAAGGSGGAGFGGAGNASFGGTGGFGGSSGSVGGSAGFGGTVILDAGPSCSTSACFTCADLASQFSWYLDAFSCGEGADGAAPYACPNLLGAGNMYCQSVCTLPVVQGSMCCYGMTQGNPACGRPFSVGEELRAAPTIARDDWHVDARAAPFDLDDELCHALAREWEMDAKLEHASIASFARLTLELLALGAPPDLVLLSQAASIDEIEHARLCFALASRYGGAAIGPGPLNVAGALSESTDLAALAAETVREGCVGETLAALLANEQLEAATDPEARQVLTRIAADEARHAELSWKIVRWAIAQGGERVSRAATAAFERALAELAAPPEATCATVTADVANWHAHGRLQASERCAVIRAALSEVIRPCARVLLA
jgi:hypothetical protein